MLVTITTPCMNSEKTIARTIESVLAQSYENIEYIIKDGGSTDETLNIARSYERRFREKGYSLKIISNKDFGLYDAINIATRQSTGFLVGNINSDDYYEKDAVKIMVDEYASNPYDVAWGDIIVKTNRGEFRKKAKIGEWVWSTSGFCHPAMFVRRELLVEHPYLNKSMVDDFEFATWALTRKKRMRVVNKVVAVFNFGGMSTKKSIKEVARRVDLVYAVYQEYGFSKLYYVQRWLYELMKYVVS